MDLIYDRNIETQIFAAEVLSKVVHLYPKETKKSVIKDYFFNSLISKNFKL